MKHLYSFILCCFFAAVNSQTINFPDPNFKARLISASSSNTIAKDLDGNYFKIDADNDGEIQVAEALNVSALALSSQTMLESAFADATGIEQFTNLQFLDVDENNLTSLAIPTLTNLIELTVTQNQLTSLDVGGFTSLKKLYAGAGILTSLNVSGCTSLEVLQVNSNQLTTLNLDGLSSLTSLLAHWNQLQTISTAGLTSLEFISCNNNDLTALDLSDMTSLNSLYASNNLITSLDISNSPDLDYFSASNNQLTNMNLKNGSSLSLASLNFSNNPNLSYICVDPNDVANVMTRLNGYNNFSCVVNTYCTFAAGGAAHEISGNNRFDIDNNGCSESDFNYPGLKFSITDGLTTGIVIPNASGAYSLPLPPGSYTVTPVLEFPEYYSVTPSSINVDFLQQPDPVIQDFCLTTSGNHPDLYISILPLDVPRPGFDSQYKIIYRNVGTTLQSGTVNFNFNDDILDYIWANPISDIQSANTLTWNFSNLLPAESGEIFLAFNVNSPVEVPAVVSGTEIDYSATVSSSQTDETPDNNSFALQQVAVNSYDPNDKTCLEGAVISPSQVGKDVHYLIRFENTGTANAQNIVVTDAINSSKLDISTLVPLDGSHSFRTKISNTNRVEFHFENINLPFDDASNDGYVAFKIKTKPTLVVGDAFSNTAYIYFDYNSAIVTNTATTTIQQLGTNDFEFSKHFTLYPVPAGDRLKIKSDVAVSSVSVYNSIGQLLLSVSAPNLEEGIDVSGLAKGSYFIRINSEKGSSSSGFLKN